MTPSKSFLLLLSALITVVDAGTLSLPFKGSRTNLPRFERHEQLLARATSEFRLLNLLTYYEITLDIGTPSQKVSFTIDTGSSDLWVMDGSNPYCASSSSQLNSGYINCTERPTIFNSQDSSSFKATEDNYFNISYYDLTFADGYFVTDDIKFGDDTLSAANFALATESNSSIAVFGVGPVAGESTVTNYTSDGEPVNAYPNIPEQLKTQGLIDTAAYSLWLNDLYAAEGELLFGGVDHAKYVGTLQLVPMVAGYIITDSDERRYPGIREEIQSREKDLPFVMLHNIYLYNDEGKAGLLASLGVPALLDSGTSLSYVPNSVLTAMVGTLLAEYNANVDGYVTYCDVEGGLALDFSGVIITVPYSQFLIPLLATDGTPITVRSGRPVCLLPMVSNPGVLILGDVIMRSMYCVFDNDNFQVAIANTRFNVTESDVESIGSDGIPKASSAPSYSSTSTAQTYSWQYVVAEDYTNDIDLVTTNNVGSGGFAGRSLFVETSTPHASQRSLSRSTRSTTSRTRSSAGSAIARSTTSRSTTSRSTTSRSSTVRPTTTTSAATDSDNSGLLLGAETSTGSGGAGTSSFNSPSASIRTTTVGNAGGVVSAGALLSLPLAIVLFL